MGESNIGSSPTPDLTINESFIQPALLGGFLPTCQVEVEIVSNY